MSPRPHRKEPRGGAVPARWLIALGIGCVIVLVPDFVHEKYGRFAVEKLPGFLAAVGLVGGGILILAARLLGMLTRRAEDHYAPKSVDAEDYPSPGLERLEHDG